MAGMSADMGEVFDLAKDIAGAGDRIVPEMRQSVSKGALNVKRVLQADMSASPSFKGVTPKLGYEMSGNASFAEATFRPGDLAHIAYEGASQGGGTVRNPQHALNEEAPRFFSAIEALAAKALLG